MIHRQVHLPIPCYDFCFLQMTRFEAIQSSQRQPPCYSLSHPIGNSDGRCVQRPETYSTQVDDLHLLGIPHSRQIITIVYPQHSSISKSSRPSRARCNSGPPSLTQANKIEMYKKLSDQSSVARERPRTSESITDLLSPQASPG